MLLATAGGEHPVTGASAHSDYGHLVSRIIAGDAEAEAELVALFRAPVSHIIRRIAKNSPMVEDFSQETFLTVIKKVRNGDLHQPESLGAFVANVARYHTIEQLRKIRHRGVGEALELGEQVPDPTPNPLEQLQASEQIEEVRDLVGQLIPRYRELLFRFYLIEESKEAICADLGLTSAQFDGVLHRARKRYKAMYLKAKGLAEEGQPT